MDKPEMRENLKIILLNSLEDGNSDWETNPRAIYHYLVNAFLISKSVF